MSEMQEMQMALPSPRKLFTPGVTGVLILCVIGYLLCALAPASVGAFGLSVEGFTRAKVWQFVTYPFLHFCPWNLIFNSMMILCVGSAIEREWRTVSFVALWLVVSIACGLLWVAVNLLTGSNFVGVGAAACCYGIIGTMALLFYGTRFFFFFTTVEAQYLALILIAIGIILNIKPPINLVWVVGAPVAYIYVKTCWSHARKGRFHARPRPTKHKGNFVDID